MKKHLHLVLFCLFSVCLGLKAEIYSGKCGKTGSNVSWTLDTETYKLKITGTGEMEDYSFSTPSPWDNKRNLIKNVTIENGVSSIGEYAFRRYTNLVSVTISESVTSIGSNAFYGCRNLSSITIPRSVTNVGLSAFHDTKWYEDQPNDVVYVGSVAYTYKGTMPENTSIVIKEGTKSITRAAFEGRETLSSITIPNSVEHIGLYAFYGSTGILYVNCNIPSAEYRSSEGWFEGSKFTEVIIGDDVTSIGRWNFGNCRDLTSIFISKSVNNINQNAFIGCNPSSIVVDNDNMVYDSRENCNGIIITASNTLLLGFVTTIIPNSVTSIGDWAFQNCKITSITIPKGVTGIGDYAFYGCTNLSSITCLNPIPPTCENDVFYNVPTSSCKLLVPASAVETYTSTSPWSKFVNIEVAPETITMNQYGSGTYCSPYALDFSEVQGLKAYAATGYNSKTGVITLTRVMTAKAGMGLFIKGEPDEYSVPVLKETDDNSLNMLVGTLEKTTVNSISDDGKYYNYRYTTKTGDPAPSFYKIADGHEFSAGKAYLQIPVAWRPEASEARNIILKFDDGNTTDIEEANSTPEETTYYDLMGRKVKNPQKGVIYIVNGKKTILN